MSAQTARSITQGSLAHAAGRKNALYKTAKPNRNYNGNSKAMGLTGSPAREKEATVSPPSDNHTTATLWAPLRRFISVWISRFPGARPNPLGGNVPRLATRTSGTVQWPEIRRSRCPRHCQHGAARVARHGNAMIRLRRVPGMHMCSVSQIG